MLVLMRMCMGMALVSMLVKVFVLFDTQGNNACMGTFYAALDALFEVISNIRDSQGIEPILTSFDIARKFSQGCEEHVACRTHIAFDIKSLHC